MMRKNTVKRFISAFFALMLILGMCACQSAPQETTAASQATETTEEAKAPTEAPEPFVYEKNATGKNGMVAAADPYAAKVGADILKAGGNAMDAAIATAYALGVAENCASGIGGSGVLLYYDAATKKTTAIDYWYTCPKNMVLGDFIGTDEHELNGMAGLYGVVPGFVAGMEKANEMFGTMPLSDLIAPAIDLAENGVPVSSFMAGNYTDYYDKMVLYEETKRVFTNDGFPYMEGDIFKNPDLAKAYRLISEQGSDVFYKGEIAESIVSSLRNTGSKITMEDLADYKVIVKEPYTTTYHGYNIAIAPPMCAGTVTLASLNLAEHFDMGSIEFGSKDYIHLWSEIFRLAWADYATALEDPDFYDLSKARGMITKEYADERYKLIDMKKSMGDGPVGKPENYDPESHTTHLSVIDSEGNMVSMTNTNSEFFGTMTTAEGYGFIIQDTNVFSAKFSSFFPEPGKRPRTTIAPILITNSDGSPYAAIGTPGSQRILTTDAMIISNLIDYGVSLEEAVNRPKLYQNRTTNLFLEGGFDESLEEELTAMGHKITWRGANDSYFGGAHCVMIDPETGEKVGCADIRRDGAAIGY